MCRKRVCRAIDKRQISFLVSLNKGAKQAWPRLSSECERQALERHGVRLSTGKGDIPEDLQKCIEDASWAVFRLARDKDPVKFMPSGSACINKKVKEGGCLGLFSPIRPISKKPAFSAAGRMVGVGKLHDLVNAVDGWRRDSMGSAIHSILDAVGVKTLADLDRDDLLPSFFDSGVLDVQAIAIAEPGKFRIISLGDGNLYSALQPLQGLMLDAWKSFPASTMKRGEDMTPKINEMLGATLGLDRLLGESLLWCSVDYEAATDLLKKASTFASYSGVERAQLPFSRLGFYSLMPGNVSYPVNFAKDAKGKVIPGPDGGPPVDLWKLPAQIAWEGQLMGHPLSFPLLCVTNLAVWHCALKRWCTKPDLIPEVIAARCKALPILWKNVLVNGDDMLFRCPYSLYLEFLQACFDAGFKISQGKNFLSARFCMINSQYYHYDSAKDEMVKCEYLHQKLVYHRSLKTGESEATPIMVARDLSRMCVALPWTACVVPMALGKWTEDWYGKRFQPNWYLPVHLGGLGMDVSLRPASNRITRSQRLMAARFVNDLRLQLYRRSGVIKGLDIVAGAVSHWILQPKMVTDVETESVPQRDLPEQIAEQALREPMVSEGTQTGGNELPGVSVGEDYVDGWLQKLAIHSRCSMRHFGLPKDKYVMAKFKPDHRLKPMSMENIERYRDAVMVCWGMPACPGLLPLTNKFNQSVASRREKSAAYGRALSVMNVDTSLSEVQSERFYRRRAEGHVQLRRARFVRLWNRREHLDALRAIGRGDLVDIDEYEDILIALGSEFGSTHALRPSTVPRLTSRPHDADWLDQDGESERKDSD